MAVVPNLRHSAGEGLRAEFLVDIFLKWFCPLREGSSTSDADFYMQSSLPTIGRVEITQALPTTRLTSVSTACTHNFSVMNHPVLRPEQEGQGQVDNYRWASDCKGKPFYPFLRLDRSPWLMKVIKAQRWEVRHRSLVGGFSQYASRDHCLSTITAVSSKSMREARSR